MSNRRHSTRGTAQDGRTNLPWWRREKGPNGRPLCTWCSAEVPIGRRSWCSQSCVDEYLIRRDPNRVRALLLKRDKGVCAECGADTLALEHELSELQRAQWERAGGVIRSRDERERCKQELRDWKVARGIPPHRETFWDADHIVPVAEGGGECDLDNYRTLCIPCHKAATAALRKRLARSSQQAEA